MCIGALWLGLRVNALGDPTALLSNGAKNPANAIVQKDMPGAFTVDGIGFDGAQFYAIARGPFAWERTSQYLDVPTYRLRRILYPLAAGALAPGGGVRLVWAMALLTVVGIGIGGWWLDAFPGAPPWLPVVMAFNPGVLCSLFASLSDGLAAGLVIAAFGAMFTRRTRLAVCFLVLACLTRETSVLAGFALAFTPGLTGRARAALAVIPVLPVAIWSVAVSRTLGSSFFAQPVGGSFTLPFAGWVGNGSTTAEMALVIGMGLLVVAALTRWRSTPISITAFLALSLAMLVCSAPVIMSQWIGTSRVMTAAIPLAVWVLAGRPSKARRRLSPSWT
jgi:hypothetical protein